VEPREEQRPSSAPLHQSSPATGLLSAPRGRGRQPLQRLAFQSGGGLPRQDGGAQDAPLLRLSRLSLDVTGVQELFLNDGLDDLTLLGTAAPELKIHAEADGSWLTLE